MQINRLKEQFPIFQAHPDLVYLDSAATSQKPLEVIQAIEQFYRGSYASINRGLYRLGAEATRSYEAVRIKVAEFIGAAAKTEIVYTNGTTDGINLVAHSFLASKLNEGDEVIVSAMEHHANLIPWQEVCKAKGAILKIAPINRKGEIILEELYTMLGPQTRMLALTHISNTLGTINPVQEIISAARERVPGLYALVDAAQSAAHYQIDVEALGCDFLVFSGHKVFGPTGIGILYGKQEHLNTMRPIRFGGDMIDTVNYSKATYAKAPRKFEAGTTNIAGVIGLGAAIDFINSLDRKSIQSHLQSLLNMATKTLSDIPALEIVGTAEHKSAIVSFVLEGIHPHDVATFLGSDQIAIRAGHHCTQPLMDAWGLAGTTRASFSVYNTEEDIIRLADGVRKIVDFFA